MKEKDRIYQSNQTQQPMRVVNLRTMKLFDQDENGCLVYARKLIRRWQSRQLVPGDRRVARRIEWRHDLTCRILAEQELGPEFEARTCNLSRGGISLLLPVQPNIGSYIAVDQCQDAAGLDLPLVEVRNVQARGNVWLVSGRWRGGLDRTSFRRLLGRRPARSHRKHHTDDQPGWLMRLWQTFRRAAG